MCSEALMQSPHWTTDKKILICTFLCSLYILINSMLLEAGRRQERCRQPEYYSIQKMESHVHVTSLTLDPSQTAL
jgi:hypothetical protein